MSEPRTELGQIIRSARLDLDMTQAAFAEHIGTTTKTIAMAETTRDVSQVYPALLELIADLDTIDRDTLYAAANRIPPEITETLIGDATALKKVRKELGL